MKNRDADVRGGVVLEIQTHPDKGRGWFENPRFWRTSFVDGRLPFLLMQEFNDIFQQMKLVDFVYPVPLELAYRSAHRWSINKLIY